ncbi:MAG: response regulator [Desulfobacter sp.]|nr:MAG: response regulator [Desulfobacter sp.]
MPWKILVVDDDEFVHNITVLSLKDFCFEGRGLEFINAYSAGEAVDCLTAHPGIALMLVDVVMESETAGLDLVRHVRQTLKNDMVQIVIRTGQPGHAPEDRVISEYRINSYIAKTEVTAQRLVSLVTTSLRTYGLTLALNQELAKRRDAEQRLREMNQTLEQKVLARTRELARANEMKSLFLANMSHEIRTPMNGILGMADMLVEEPLTPAQHEYVSIIRSSGNTLLSLINDILDLSKIEAGQIRFEYRDFDLCRLVEETLGVFRLKASQKGLALGAEVDPNLPAVLRGDSLRIKQILVNLLGNALKFTEEGRVGVQAIQEGCQGKDIMLTLAVHDTGPGIDPAFEKKIFESFSQQDASFTRKYGGTGLGLAITRQLALLMGGGIRVRNRPGGGAEFRVSLRLEKGAGRIKVPEQMAGTGGGGGLEEMISGKALKVLVAEDNPVNQKVLSLMLEKAGIVPDLAEDGEAVLEKLRRSSYDILIMDVQMPRMDGLETTRRIRDRDSDIPQKDIYIIALTAMAMKQDEQACKKAGMDRFLTKPVHPRELMQAIAGAPACI